MSYLDPIQTALDKSSPIPHGGLKAIAQLFGIVSIPISIYFFARANQSGWDNLPWPVVPGVILFLMAGFGAICAVLLLFALFLQGVPETLTVIEKNFSDYYRRNVVGYTLVLFRSRGSIHAYVCYNKGAKGQYGFCQALRLPLGGWFRKGGYLHHGVRLPWGVQLGPQWGDGLTVRLRFPDKVSFVFPADWIMGVLYDLEKSGIDTRLSWNSLIQRLRAQWMIEQDRADRATRELEGNAQLLEVERARTAAWSRSYLQLIDWIMQTKRFQHSKEAEQILRLALEDLVALYPEGSEGRAIWQRQLDQLNERIAKREGARVS